VTIDAAWQLHADDALGSISAGKHADFVVLDRDPEEVDPREIDQIRVLQTWMGAKRTYRARLAVRGRFRGPLAAEAGQQPRQHHGARDAGQPP
jgi:cytosine/adenosine deaminase-related metal-dependent hydrolase